MLNQGNAVGIRLVYTEFGGTSHYSTSQTLYSSDDQTVIYGIDLIEESKRDDLLQYLKDVAQEKGVMQENASPTVEEVFQDISFSQAGELLVNIPKGNLASSDMNNVLVKISDADQYLSAAGKDIKNKTASVHLPEGHTQQASDNKSVEGSPDVDCPQKKCIALTFDDGPGPYTNEILDTLQHYQARATFFTIGRNVVADPKTVQ